MRPPLLAGLCSLWLAACSDPAGPADPGPVVLEHDFGVIPHGSTGEFRFAIPTPPGRSDCYPLGLRVACACSQHDFLVVGADGAERATGPAIAENERAVRAGEQLVLRLRIDTSRKEAVDTPKMSFPGEVLLHVPGREDPERVRVLFKFAIDAPIRVSPVAHIDFGSLPYCRTFAQTVELHPDRTDPPVRLGPVRTSDPRLHADLREDEGVMLLDVKFAPQPTDAEQTVVAAVSVASDLPGYTLTIPVTGQITDAIAIEPSNHLGFDYIDFDNPAERFVFVTDHDPARPAEFALLDVQDPNGASLAQHFAVALAPVDGLPRTTRVVVRYLGGLSGNSWRGLVRLCKPGTTVPVASFTFNAIASR